MKSEVLKNAIKDIKKMTHYEILEEIKYYKSREDRLGKKEKQYLQSLEKEEKVRNEKLINNLKNLKTDMFSTLFK